MNDNNTKICVIVPTYNNAKTLAGVIAELKSYPYPIIVVNDGSTDLTTSVLAAIDNIEVCSYTPNKGKGYALQIGFKKALLLGFDYAVTMDSDGQHHACEIVLLVEKSEENPTAIVVGSRNLQVNHMSGKNTFANKFSNFWFKMETGLKPEDIQSGFRLYPLHAIAGRKYFTRHYDFELEILVRSAWREIPIVFTPVSVTYLPKEEHISNFKPVSDFMRISLLNTVLVLITFLWIKPARQLRKFHPKSIGKYLKEKVFSTTDSNKKIALSVSLGIFMGIIPVWGYQMVVAFALAHLLKLNKAIALVSSNISIPPMIPLILYGSYRTGIFIAGDSSDFDISFDAVRQNIFQYLIGSLVFAAVCAVIFGIIVYLLLNIFRKKGKV
ncbi:MAG: DUF2062 domain-containing protein [Candidatus Azobacteroides sp.]|nr:DUF2062 domain-containing protein [Candidatus Azobacteroides sp.]